jgi:hypothetical protein
MIPPNQPCRSTSQNCHSTPNFDHSLQNTLPFDTPMLPFPMFRLRQSRPHSQLPSASVQYLSVPATCARHLHRSARHSSTCDLASLLPRVTSHASPIANSFRIRTSEKHAPNPFRIRTSKTQHLKPFRMNTYEKTPQGEGPHPSSRLRSQPIPPYPLLPSQSRRPCVKLFSHSTFNFRLSTVSRQLQPKGGSTTSICQQC